MEELEHSQKVEDRVEKRRRVRGDRRRHLALALLLVGLAAVVRTEIALLLLAGLSPRLLPCRGPAVETHRPGLDALIALGVGLAVPALCHFLWLPSLLITPEGLSSDTAEHFFLLHSVGNPGWGGWSFNRYPLPTLLARALGASGTPYEIWYRSAIVSMGAIAAGLYLWGRAVAGIGAGLAAALLIGAYPDLIVMTRTVTAYPVILALWTCGAAFAAYALRFPSPWTCLTAGIGLAGIFLSDARGLMAGLSTLPVVVIAAVSAGSWGRRAVQLGCALVPLALSYPLQGRLPIPLASLEAMFETAVEDSYRRIGVKPPPQRMEHKSNYVWGRSNLLDIPTTIGSLADARSRLNPAVKTSRRQIELANRRVIPLVLPLGLLALLGLVIGAGWHRRAGEAWRHAFLRYIDWRGKIGLLSVGAGLSILVNAIEFSYYPRYAALGAPALLVLAGVGLGALAGRRAPPWSMPFVVGLILYVLPGALHVHASWRSPIAGPRELLECVSVLKPNPLPPSDDSTRNCMKAMRDPLPPPIWWPYGMEPRVPDLMPSPAKNHAVPRQRDSGAEAVHPSR